MAVEKGINTELPVGVVKTEEVQITETPIEPNQLELDDGSVVVGKLLDCDNVQYICFCLLGLGRASRLTMMSV